MPVLAKEREFVRGLGRAFAGALIFSLPMLMTMELWWMGHYLSEWRLMLFLLVSLPLLFGLSRFGGFEQTDGSVLRDLADALVALAVAAVCSTVVLFVFNIISIGASPRELIGRILLQIVPASIGALLARSQLGGASVDQEEKRQAGSGSYPGELFVMIAGALFLSLNVAPTEEMMLIAYKMSFWHEITLVLLSLAIMHGLVYSVQFRGGHERPGGASFLSTFARFSLAGYGFVLLVSLGVLWLFGRIEGHSADEIASIVVVLAFPGAIGAAAARLIL